MIAGRYSFTNEMGRDGSGVRWVGLDERTGRRVVLEQVGGVGGAVGADSSDRDRAERHARAAAGFAHPHAATVLDIVTDDETGLLWLVSEPVEGMTLTDMVHRNGAHDMDFTLDVARQTTEALAAAHGVGVVHGDVSPDNISVDRLGHVTVTGFGIARIPAQPSTPRPNPVYLAPEVVAGDTGDEASDVWSLGATLFFAMTGSPPYDTAPDLRTGLLPIIDDQPPRLPNAGVLGSLLEVTMVKEPWQRWSMTAVHDRLAGPFDVLAVPVTPRRAPRSAAPPIGWKLPALLAAALLVAGAVGVILLDKEKAGDSITTPLGQPHRPAESLPSSAPTSSLGSSAGSPSGDTLGSSSASRAPFPAPSDRASRTTSVGSSKKHGSKHGSKNSRSKRATKHAAKHPSKHRAKPGAKPPRPHKPKPPHGHKPSPPHGHKPSPPKGPKPAHPNDPKPTPPHNAPHNPPPGPKAPSHPAPRPPAHLPPRPPVHHAPNPPVHHAPNPPAHHPPKPAPHSAPKPPAHHTAPRPGPPNDPKPGPPHGPPPGPPHRH